MNRILLVFAFCLAFVARIQAEIAPPNKVIVFDFGGVIVHSDKEKTAFYEFIQDTFHFDQTTLREIRTHFELLSREVKISDIAFWLELAEKHRVALPSDWKARYDAAVIESFNESKEMRDIIQFYKEKGIQIALLSNVPAKHAAFLRAHGFYDDFSPVLLSCDIGVSKPDPRSFQILLSEINRSPEDCIFIDDKKDNIDAAKALGIDAIQFFSAEQVGEELKARFK